MLLHCVALFCTICTVLHCVALVCTGLHCVALCGTVWHCVALCGTVWHCFALCGTVWHWFALSCTATVFNADWYERVCQVRLNCLLQVVMVTVHTHTEGSRPGCLADRLLAGFCFLRYKLWLKTALMCTNPIVCTNLIHHAGGANTASGVLYSRGCADTRMGHPCTEGRGAWLCYVVRFFVINHPHLPIESSSAATQACNGIVAWAVSMLCCLCSIISDYFCQVLFGLRTCCDLTGSPARGKDCYYLSRPEHFSYRALASGAEQWHLTFFLPF